MLQAAASHPPLMLKTAHGSQSTRMLSGLQRWLPGIAGRAAPCLALLLNITLLLGQFSECLQVTNPEDWALLFQSSVDFVTKLENS